MTAFEVVMEAFEVVTGAADDLEVAEDEAGGAGDEPDTTDMDILLVRVTSDPSKGSVPA